MRRFLILLVVSTSLSVSMAWAQGLPSAKPEDVGLSSERLGRIGKVLQAEIQAKKLPGAIAVVARRGGSPTSRRSARAIRRAAPR
jgi:hypothetical protein